METPAQPSFLKKYKVLLIAAGAVLLAVVIWLIATGESPSSGLSVTPTDSDREGVAPDAAFLIALEPEMEAPEISTDPQLAYLLREEEGGIRLTFAAPLAPRQEFAILVDGRRFPFRVRNQLIVTAAYPVNGAKEVPVGAGVEIAFNTALEPEALNGALTVTPSMEGAFVREGERLVYRHEEPFAPQTAYTFAIGEGLANDQEATLRQAYQVTFTTGYGEAPENDFYVAGAGRSINLLPEEVPVFQSYAKGFFEENPAVEVAIEKFDGWESFQEALEREEGMELPAGGLETVATYEIVPFQPDGGGPVSVYGSSWLIPMPDALEQGWYAVTFSVKKEDARKTVTKLVQVSDLSVYYITADDNLLVWINDTVTGQPVEGAQVSFAGDWEAQVTTDAQGLATLAHLPIKAAEESEYYRNVYSRFQVRAGDRVFIGDSQGSVYLNPDSEASHRYYSFLYTDRDIYRTSDTIRVWGVIRPRSGSAAPKEATLELGNQVLTQTVQIAADGTFQAELELAGMAPAWLPLTLGVGEGPLRTSYLNIQDFVKPVHTASGAAGRPVYLLTGEDSLTSTLHVSTFDGTPAANMQIRLEPAGGAVEVSAGAPVTDGQGNLEVKLAVAEDRDSWYPVEYQYYASADSAVQENFRYYGSVYAIHRDVILTGKPVFGTSAGEDAVEISTHRVDVSGIARPAQLWEQGAIQGAALDQDVTVEFYKVFYEQLLDGTYYDFMEKEWKERYRYQRQEELTDTRTVSTKNGTYRLENLPESDDTTAFYYLRLTTRDSRGRQVESTTYLGNLYGAPGINRDGITRYGLSKVETGQGVAQESGGSYSYHYSRNRFTDGETVTFQLRENDVDMETAPGRLLSCTLQDTIENVAVGTAVTQVTLPYREELLPNYTITGAYFDGKYVFPLETNNVYFDSAQRELEISLTPHKESYQPGETMELAAAVRNKDTGAPAGETVLLLSVVDEAIFAVQEQYVNFLDEYYQGVFYPSVHQYTSYSQNTPLTGGEKGGGGGGDSLRAKFEDTPYFAAVTTEADGKATIRVPFPDNITSWRLTTAAITPQNHVGNGRDHVSVTKEFFVTPVVAETMLAGDSLSVGLTSAGTGVQTGDAVTYTVGVEGGSQGEVVSAQVGSYAAVDLGKLPEGEYTVTVEGSCGSYRDGVSLPVQVVASGVEVSMVKTLQVGSGGMNINPLRYPVSINFYSENAQDYNAVFRAVAAGSRGARAEARLAARYVASRYSSQGVKWYNQEALTADLSDLTGWPMAKLPGGAVDYEVTTKAVLALPRYFGEYYLQRIYYDYTAYGEEAVQGAQGRKSVLYLAQAIGAPTAYADLEGQMTAPNLDYVDQIYYAMAMAQVGNRSAAQTWYGTLVTRNLQTLTGAGGRASYVTDPQGKVSDLEATAAASLFATMLETEDAHGLARYLAEKQEEHGERYLLEMIYYLEHFAPTQSGDAALAYTRDGQTHTLALNGWLAPVSFTREQLAQADFQTEGSVYADIYYLGAPEELTDSSKRMIGFTKTVEPYGGGEITTGSLVKITLTPDLSELDLDIGEAQLVIDDYIPTGLRFESYTYAQEEELANQEPIDPDRPQEPVDPNEPASSGKGWHLVSRQGQRLQFCVYGAGSPGGLRPIVYYARCAAPGEFVVESAYITASSGVWGMSERGAVEVR